MWCVIGPVIALRRLAMTIDPRRDTGDHLPHRVPHGHGRLAGWRPHRRAGIHSCMYWYYWNQGTKVPWSKVPRSQFWVAEKTAAADFVIHEILFAGDSRVPTGTLPAASWTLQVLAENVYTGECSTGTGRS